MRVGDTPSVLSETADALRLFEEVGLLGTQAESRALFRASYRGVVELRIAAQLAKAEAAGLQGDADQAQKLLRAAIASSDQSRAQLLQEGGADFSAGVEIVALHEDLHVSLP